eukprot:1642954-Pleurochrysis_carterae.AAC.1
MPGRARASTAARPGRVLGCWRRRAVYRCCVRATTQPRAVAGCVGGWAGCASCERTKAARAGADAVGERAVRTRAARSTCGPASGGVCERPSLRRRA